MATVRASCPNCHDDADFTSEEVTVYFDDPENKSGHYSFFHKACGQEVIKAANQRTLDLLAASNYVVVDFVNCPEELKDPARVALEPFSNNDVADFINEIFRSDKPTAGDPRLDSIV